MTQPLAKPPAPNPDPLNQLIVTHLFGAIRFGYITIKYEDWKPTRVERHEDIRLTGKDPD